MVTCMYEHIVFDLDNVVWYGNYQRHGYLFSELMYRIKNKIALNTPVLLPFEQFLAGWNEYITCLHLTAPQQLDSFFDRLIEGGFLAFQQEEQRMYFRQICVEWLENKYWELVSHPERLYIADQSYEYGRKVSLVPGVRASLSFLRQQKAKRELKIYAVSLNLQHISQAILSMLDVVDIFDEIHGVSWDLPSSTKEEILRKILLEQHVKENQAVIIGDAIGDITAGQKAGIKT